MSSALKPWLILAVIFLAGGFTGSALTMVLSGQFTHPAGGPFGPPSDMRQAWMGSLTRHLNLTPDQQAKIEPILRDTSDKVQAIHRGEFAQVRDILKASDDQIAAILTPDQKAELQKMIEEREKDFTGRMRRWGPGHDGGPGGMHDGMHFHGGGPGGPGGAYPDQPDQTPPPNAAPTATNAPPK
jgi:Spy/CpxP family protein refolding chaperone